jgi:hypothetical protein
MLLHLCATVLPMTPTEDPSLARSLLRTRLMKCLWEALRYPGFADRCLPKLGLILPPVLAAAARLTSVPLTATIEALAARSIALCAMVADNLAEPPTTSNGLRQAWQSSVEASVWGEKQAKVDHPPPPSVTVADETLLVTTATELDPTLLLQATPEPEVLMLEELDVSCHLAGANWLSEAVQGRPLQTSSLAAMLNDLAAAEHALFVYYARLALLALLRDKPQVATDLAGGVELMSVLRPLFICSHDSVNFRLPLRCPRSLMRGMISPQCMLHAVDAAFEAWATAVSTSALNSEKVLGALEDMCAREVQSLKLTGAGLEEYICSVVVESPHEYKNRTLFARKLTMPQASSLQVIFDTRCSTEKKCDYLTFYAHEEDWRNSKPPLRMCDGPPSSTGWKTPLIVKGSQLVYTFHSDKRNTDWGYRFTVTGLNKNLEPRPTRSFTLEGVHPGKERNFTGAETFHVLADNTHGPPPGLQLQFHPTCSVEKPDQVSGLHTSAAQHRVQRNRG